MNVNQHHRAGFPVLWIQTAEQDRTATTLSEALSTEGVAVYSWDLLRGVRGRDGSTHSAADPVEALAWLSSHNNGALALVTSLLHRFATAPEVQQAVISGAPAWKASGRQLVVLVPPGTKPPLELERVVHVIEEALPSPAELTSIVTTLTAENGVTLPVAASDIAESLRGLTCAEAENLLALAAVRGGGSVDVAEIQTEASRTIKAASGGTLELARPEGGFASLGGLERIKSFCGRAVRSPDARGVVALGVPGTGKTAFALALGAEANLPVYLWDLGRLFGSLVGESEASARRTIAAIEAAGKCIVLIDEIEKGAAGMSGSSGDSGTTQRTMGTVLKWLSDRQAGGAYVIATCNDVSKLPPELTRAERWDATFFVDLPTRAEREVIYAIHAKHFEVTEAFPAELTEHWTGAEIKSLCRIAHLLGAPLAEAGQYVIPLSRSRSEEIQALRQWAAGRCVPASVPAPAATPKPRAVRINRNSN